MKNFIHLFKKVGGREILRQYKQANVLIFALIETLILGFSKKSLEIVRHAANNRILRNLRRKYNHIIKGNLIETDDESLHHKSNKVWVCWLQGIENAPIIVQKCYKSICENLYDKEIVLITENNYNDYVTFPKYIQDKIDNGVISKTHMSDLLRLELLIKYGGTWIDATVYCSGNNIPKYMVDSELFMFQNLKPGLDGHSTCVSSWFITSYTNHPILLLTRTLLYKYWEENTKMVDYFLFHDFMQLAIEVYSEEWNKVVPFSNSTPHILLLRLFDKYDEKIWNAVKDMTPFHKLTYKYDEDKSVLEGTYCKTILEL